MNTINMNVTLRQADATVLFHAAGMHILHKDDLKTFNAVIEYLKTLGIDVRKLSHGDAVIFRTDDPRIDKILSASIRELPEFLADEEQGVRMLAAHRLKEQRETDI